MISLILNADLNSLRIELRWIRSPFRLPPLLLLVVS